MAKELHIFISAEPLFHVGGITITNTMFTSFLVSTLLLLFFVYANAQLKNTKKPTGVQNFVEMVVEALIGLVEDVAGKGSKAITFLPLVASFLVFIMFNNWFELLPGVHTVSYIGKSTIELANVPAALKASPVWASTTQALEKATDTPVVESESGEHAAEALTTETPLESEAHEAAPAEEGHAAESGEHAVAFLRGANADLNLTLALAIISVGATQYFGLRFAKLGYLKKFFNFSSPINFAIGLLELVLEFSKIMSFGFRLFGNIFAGEVLLSVIVFLIPVFLPIPFIGLELFVGALQAYVFAMLSLVFFSMAASEHH